MPPALGARYDVDLSFTWGGTCAVQLYAAAGGRPPVVFFRGRWWTASPAGARAARALITRARAAHPPPPSLSPWDWAAAGLGLGAVAAAVARRKRHPARVSAAAP
jgi:hypothetical protein